MFCKIIAFKNCDKFIRKQLCQSLVFNKVISWKVSQNLQTTCGRVSFYNKALGSKHNINIKLFKSLHFFNASLITKFDFFHHLHIVLLLITEKSGNCFHFVNNISNVGSFGDVLQKNPSKSKKTRISAQNCQSRWIFFLDLVLKQTKRVSRILKICCFINCSNNAIFKMIHYEVLPTEYIILVILLVNIFVKIRSVKSLNLNSISVSLLRVKFWKKFSVPLRLKHYLFIKYLITGC